MKRLYFIAIQLPEPYSSEIESLKKELAVRFDSRHSLKTIPHITLQMPVRIEEENEDVLINSLLEIPKRIDKDPIRLNGIDHFGERTIFIDVRKEGLVVQLFNAVSRILSSLDFFPKSHIATEFHPHITLMTRDLTKRNFQLAYPELRKLEFHHVIPIDRFALFRHNGIQWKVLTEFILKD